MAVNFTAADRVGGIGGYIGGISTLLGMMGNGGLLGSTAVVEDRCVTRHEMDLLREIQTKDQQIAIADSENYTDKKLVEVYSELAKQDRTIRDLIDANYKEQAGINLTQATYNATNTAAIGCMQNQIATLQSMTKLVIPNTSVCPGWGDVTITPKAG